LTGAPERALRTTAFFLALVPIFVGFDVALRVALALGAPPTRRRCVNTLTSAWGTCLSRLLQRVLGMRLEVRGRVPEGRCVVVANHQSTADIVLLIDALRPMPCKFVAKDALGRHVPFVSRALRDGGSVLVAREGGRAELRAIERMGRELGDWDACAVVFAEGTRTRDGSVGTFQAAGARILAREGGLPLVPACIEGAQAATELADFSRGLLGAHVVITFGEPVAAPSDAGAFRATLEGLERWTAGVQASVRAERASREASAAPGA
jgi:1-acyl-sn-glycerol-3-phosphate acyltransferase